MEANENALGPKAWGPGGSACGERVARIRHFHLRLGVPRRLRVPRSVAQGDAGARAAADAMKRPSGACANQESAFIRSGCH